MCHFRWFYEIDFDWIFNSIRYFGLCCSMQRSLHFLHAFWILVWRLKLVSEFSSHLNSTFGLDSGGQNLLYFCLLSNFHLPIIFCSVVNSGILKSEARFHYFYDFRLFCQHRFSTSDVLWNLELKFHHQIKSLANFRWKRLIKLKLSLR